MKTEETERTATLEFKLQTPVNNPEQITIYFINLVRKHNIQKS
jgi:hypothetical protein